jgi:hypothetical protein
MQQAEHLLGLCTLQRDSTPKLLSWFIRWLVVSGLRICGLVPLGLRLVRFGTAAFSIGATWRIGTGLAAFASAFHGLAAFFAVDLAVFVGVDRIEVGLHPLGSFFLRDAAVAVLIELLPELVGIEASPSRGTSGATVAAAFATAFSIGSGTWVVTFGSRASAFSIRTRAVPLSARATFRSHVAATLTGKRRGAHQLAGIECAVSILIEGSKDFRSL